MTQHDFTALYSAYDSVIDEMPDEFTSHEFILRLAQQNQLEYVRALSAYEERFPFQAVHSVLSSRLREHTDRVRYVGEVNSIDIFGHPNGCSAWVKLTD